MGLRKNSIIGKMEFKIIKSENSGKRKIEARKIMRNACSKVLYTYLKLSGRCCNKEKQDQL